MKLNVQKELAARIAKASPKRVRLDPERLEEIKEVITKEDMKSLMKDGAVKIKQKKGISRARAKKRQQQRKKGRQQGHGSRKGSKNARKDQKQFWIRKIRLQRSFIKELKDKEIIENSVYRNLYRKAKGGFFRSKRHIKTYIAEHNLTK